jgi:hypothetical protein
MYSLDRVSATFEPPCASQSSHPAVPEYLATAVKALSPTVLCRNCSNLISGEYYRINGRTVCSPCAVQARTGRSSDSQVAYACALFFGIGGAIFGNILYAGFAIATHRTMGCVALAVGWIVGNSMQQGSNGLGGSRHQLTAVLLTYSAVSIAAIPVNLFDAYSQAGALTNWAGLLNRIPIWGLASPFLGMEADPLNSGIRLIMLLLGSCIAWKITQTKPLSVAGPYGLLTD